MRKARALLKDWQKYDKRHNDNKSSRGKMLPALSLGETSTGAANPCVHRKSRISAILLAPRTASGDTAEITDQMRIVHLRIAKLAWRTKTRRCNLRRL